MSEQNPAHLITPLFEEEAKNVLRKHGCTLEEHQDRCILFFPEGTTKTEMFPRTANEHYRLTFPDGYQLYEDYDRYREISRLRYSPE